jgi:hypothetical protein
MIFYNAMLQFSSGMHGFTYIIVLKGIFCYQRGIFVFCFPAENTAADAAQ